jgi:hypothetical protein
MQPGQHARKQIDARTLVLGAAMVAMTLLGGSLPL